MDITGIFKASSVAVFMVTLVGCGGGGGGTKTTTPDNNDSTTYPITTGLWVFETKSADDNSVRREAIIHDTRNGWSYKQCHSKDTSTSALSPSLDFAIGTCNIQEVTAAGINDYQIICPTLGWTQIYRKISEQPSYQGTVTLMLNGETVINTNDACVNINFEEDQTGNLLVPPSLTLFDNQGNEVLSLRFENTFPTVGEYSTSFNDDSDFSFSSLELSGKANGSVNNGTLSITRISNFFFDATFNLTTTGGDQVTGIIQFPF